MNVEIADSNDIPAWLVLAAEVEPLFGPMVRDAGFLRSLAKNIERGSAFCVRETGRRTGLPLLGAMMFSPHPPTYTIGWLAVCQQHRRRGIGRLLVEHALSLVSPPAEIVVTTFAGNTPEGLPARRLYERLGFTPAEAAPDGPEGKPRQVLRRRIHSRA